MVDLRPKNRMRAVVQQEERNEQFTVLFESHRRRLFNYLLALTGDFTVAEDAFQEACVVMWQKFPEFEQGTNFGGWACKIGYHMVLRIREQQGKRVSLLGPRFVDAVQASMTQGDGHNGRGKALRQCVLKLSERDRELLSHRYGGDAPTAKNVAQTLGRPENTVYKALRRIRASLAECVRRTLAREEQT